MAIEINIEYILGRTSEGQPQLACAEEAVACVRGLIMTKMSDYVAFGKRNLNGSNYKTLWGLEDIDCFTELKKYTRLVHLPDEGIVDLAARMYETLYLDISHCDRKERMPVIAVQNQIYCGIVTELKVLQRAEQNLFDTKKSLVANVTAEELAMMGSW